MTAPATSHTVRTGRLPQVTPRQARVLVVVALLVAAEVLTRVGAISHMTLAPPTEIGRALSELVGTSMFYDDMARTLYTIGVAFLYGAVIGLLLGLLFWRLPALGAIFEPYLASLYAMPTLVFYPILLAILGLGPAPIIAIASMMAAVPIALNTMVALRSVSSVLPKLGKSLRCNRRQLYLKIIFPAATPLAIPGLKLGFIYTVIGTVAMEFILASHGAGFRLGYAYRDFDIEGMYAYIVVVIGISVIANSSLNALERRVRRDMA